MYDMTNLVIYQWNLLWDPLWKRKYLLPKKMHKNILHLHLVLNTVIAKPSVLSSLLAKNVTTYAIPFWTPHKFSILYSLFLYYIIFSFHMAGFYVFFQWSLCMLSHFLILNTFFTTQVEKKCIWNRTIKP